MCVFIRSYLGKARYGVIWIKKSASGFDPDDHDIDAYYEDYKDIEDFEDIDDAYDDFEDNPNYWDDYWCFNGERR